MCVELNRLEAKIAAFAPIEGGRHMKSVSDKAEGLRLLDQQQVLALFPISRVTLYRKVRAGEFPRPSRIGQKNFWREAAVLEWLSQYGAAA